MHQAEENRPAFNSGSEEDIYRQMERDPYIQEERESP